MFSVYSVMYLKASWKHWRPSSEYESRNLTQFFFPTS